MIFNVPGHIDMIRNGVSKGYHSHVPQESPTFPVKLIPEQVVKTQTRRLNRGIYQVGKDYAVQCKRGVKAEPDIRIVIDKIGMAQMDPIFSSFELDFDIIDPAISEGDAWAEGGYTPLEFEKIFQKLNPKWDGKVRWIFVFHAIEVQR